MKRIAFTTLGCKANWTDTEACREALQGLGLQVVSSDEFADAYLINTCTVTQVADLKSRQMIRRARRKNPRAVVVAFGCLGERDRGQLEAIDAVDRVFGTSDRDLMIAYLVKELGFKCDPPRLAIPVKEQSRARAFLKIQDGCGRRCAYCVVPGVRGRSRSVAADDVIRASCELSRHHKEIVLTGIDIGQYRDEKKGWGLTRLLTELAASPDVSRLRLSSIDPTNVTRELVSLIKDSESICRHVHLSIQSCSTSVISRMGRSYKSDDIKAAVLSLVDTIPHVAVSGDIITCFPGETDKEHEETLELLSKLPMASLHVFPYSPRAGTRAHDMAGRLGPAVVKARASELGRLSRRMRQNFLNGLVGKSFDVIVTNEEKSGTDGFVSAFSDNAVSMLVPAGVFGYRGIGRARITQTDNMKVTGTWE